MQITLLEILQILTTLMGFLAGFFAVFKFIKISYDKKFEQFENKLAVFADKVVYERDLFKHLESLTSSIDDLKTEIQNSNKRTDNLMMHMLKGGKDGKY